MSSINDLIILLLPDTAENGLEAIEEIPLGVVGPSPVLRTTTRPASVALNDHSESFFRLSIQGSDILRLPSSFALDEPEINFLGEEECSYPTLLIDIKVDLVFARVDMHYKALKLMQTYREKFPANSLVVVLVAHSSDEFCKEPWLLPALTISLRTLTLQFLLRRIMS